MNVPDEVARVPNDDFLDTYGRQPHPNCRILLGARTGDLNSYSWEPSASVNRYIDVAAQPIRCQ